MEKDQTLEERLDDIGSRIDQAREKIRLQHVLYNEHGATGEDLKKRYNLLQEQVNREVATEESHGHHVTALERSVLEWLDHLSFDK